MGKNVTYNIEINKPIDGFEVHPCKVVGKLENGKQVIEQCEIEEADFYGVYVHFVNGGLECIADRPTNTEAQAYVDSLESIIKCFLQPAE